MSDKDPAERKPQLARRGLLTGAGVAAAASAAVPLVSENAAAFDAPPDERAARYKDSAYAQRFYALNRR